MKYLFTSFFLLSNILLCAQDVEKVTSFNFGGYIKADFINTWYQNGDVGERSPLRDFHLPGHIPVGPSDQNFDLDYHTKESRFNFDVKSNILGKEIHGFIELDFMLSSAGDEKVSNSFNPRLRHAYFEWDRLLVGQTWSSFMVVVVPDEIDFSGALDGLVFVRQLQIRYKAGSWWFALENPETTITEYQGSATNVTDSEILPDIIVRKNFSGHWGNWTIAAIGRTLHKRDSLSNSTVGFGLTTGGKLVVGGQGDDFRAVATYGSGLGRYLAAGFLSGAVVDENQKLNVIQTINGYIAYNHFWKPKTLSSSFSLSAYKAMHNNELVSNDINDMSYSISGNLKWDPVSKLRLGVEYIYAGRELLDGTSGTFHRIQFAAKYTFGYHNSVADEKR
ncbi:DcaP family trimeric outer membrane transporter [Saccharicrinis aurantiacus]|uniref:DcaP family trimeric outer membrane transporter n=1 Tax=Saccharicrinis aurantiacus TaxID=1849719 RepID=UPI00094FFC36|nr:DcaP family trimeric outer membrane transporter [Saccharicrinis aurantiacus]